ncbi:LDHB [Symbiodinium necroappetens]|uniref:LDHB protein n=1 Tax=Symbiodinium necroappetens TaxID=1628268 RepID=A0A813API3_9DINO|nr:LDHB [Symbiodinium necroappetens]
MVLSFVLGQAWEIVGSPALLNSPFEAAQQCVQTDLIPVGASERQSVLVRFGPPFVAYEEELGSDASQPQLLHDAIATDFSFLAKVDSFCRQGVEKTPGASWLLLAETCAVLNRSVSLGAVQVPVPLPVRRLQAVSSFLRSGGGGGPSSRFSCFVRREEAARLASVRSS